MSEARPRIPPLAVASAGVLASSTAGVLIRQAQGEAAAVVIAAWRLGIAAAVLALVAAVMAVVAAFAARKKRKNAAGRNLARAASVRRSDAGAAGLAGLFLAAHFLTWIASLDHTTVLSSVALVSTSPLWIALLGPLLLKERLGWRAAGGMLCAFAGTMVVVAAGGRAAGLAPHPDPVRGNLLALTGGLCAAGYFLAGRRVRARLSLLAYATLAYGAAAVVCAAAAVLSPHPAGGFGGRTWTALVLLALGPQLLGHSSLNWALRYIPAATVAILLLGEPVGSAALAATFLGEIPGWKEMAGAGLVLAGIQLAVRRKS